MGKLLTAKEACKMINASKPTLYKYVKSGAIKKIVFGPRMHRYDEDDIQKFLSDNKTGG